MTITMGSRYLFFFQTRKYKLTEHDKGIHRTTSGVSSCEGERSYAGAGSGAFCGDFLLHSHNRQRGGGTGCQVQV